MGDTFSNRSVAIFHGACSRLRVLKYRLLGMSISGRPRLMKVDIPRNWPSIQLAHGVALDNGVTLISGVREGIAINIGDGVYINRYTIIDANESITVGKGAMIGPYCYITDGDHGTGKEQPIPLQPMETKPTCIEEDAWLGARVTVLKGVTIGKGAVIGAGSVVNRNIPDYAIAIGTPAKVVRYRE